MLTDQSHEEDEDVDFTGVLAEEVDNHNLTGDLMSEEDQDYGESFAEEFKLKQA